MGIVVLFSLLFQDQDVDSVGILTVPHPLLHTVAKPVDAIDEQVRSVAFELEKKLHAIDRKWSPFALGFAAPQIGYSVRVIGIKRSYGDYQIMINPEPIQQKWLVPFIARCFSVPGTFFMPRYLWMHVRYSDLEGGEHEEIFRWGKAAVLQQEVDHLNGILISD